MSLRATSFTIFLFMAVLNGCSNKSDPSAEIQLPPVYLSCPQTSSVDCVSSSAGKKFYVGLLENTQLDCEQELLKGNSNTFYLYFDFSGSGDAVFLGELEGEVSSWIDTENQQAFYMKKTNYKACAFLDINSNGQLDPTEVVGELVFSYSNNQPTIIDWY